MAYACQISHVLIAADRASLLQLQQAITARRSRLDRVADQLVSSRSDVLGNKLPTLLRYQTLTLSHVDAMLFCEQRARMRELLDIFSLRINALRSGNLQQPIQITICNLRLPNGSIQPSPDPGQSDPQVLPSILSTYCWLLAACSSI